MLRSEMIQKNYKIAFKLKKLYLGQYFPKKEVSREEKALRAVPDVKN